MKNFLLKIIIVLITGSILGVSLFYFWKNKYAFSKNEIVIENVLNDENKKSDLQNIETDEKKYNGKNEIIGYIEKNINKIAPENPASGLIWHSVKIWFIDDNNFYADYKDELSNLRRILVFRSGSGSIAEYEVLGFFIPGENGWILKTGKDIKSDNLLKLYEKNEQSNEWIAR